jgi:hypothetical protein
MNDQLFNISNGLGGLKFLAGISTANRNLRKVS